MSKATIGTISHATLRNSDLLSTFSDTLRELDEENKHTGLLEECASILDKYSEDDINYPKTEDLAIAIAELINEDLFNALNSLAPPYCYFGCTEGDGSDFGFWLSVSNDSEAFEDFQETCSNNEINFRCSDISHLPTGYVLLVNDHGNATLYEYELKLKHVWSIV